MRQTHKFFGKAGLKINIFKEILNSILGLAMRHYIQWEDCSSSLIFRHKKPYSFVQNFVFLFVKLKIWYFIYIYKLLFLYKYRWFCDSEQNKCITKSKTNVVLGFDRQIPFGPALWQTLQSLKQHRSGGLLLPFSSQN